jgi:hypothetical protein
MAGAMVGGNQHCANATRSSLAGCAGQAGGGSAWPQPCQINTRPNATTGRLLHYMQCNTAAALHRHAATAESRHLPKPRNRPDSESLQFQSSMEVSRSQTISSPHQLALSPRSTI